MAMVFVEEPIVSRLDRLDVMLKHLEEIKGYNRSPRSSYASTLSSKTHVSDERTSSSVDSSPKNMEKHCRPIDTVMIETEIKGMSQSSVNAQMGQEDVWRLAIEQMVEIEVKRQIENAELK
ncbi:hypothetical protein FRX31_019371, partial [Thalictrum thalictroides]